MVNVFANNVLWKYMTRKFEEDIRNVNFYGNTKFIRLESGRIIPIVSHEKCFVT